MPITTGNTPAALGGGRLADEPPKGKRHAIKLRHEDGPLAGQRGTTYVKAASRDRAEEIARQAFPRATVFAHKPVEG